MPRYWPKGIDQDIFNSLDAPWERIIVRERGIVEGDAQYQAWCLYRDLGSARSIRAVSEALHMPRQTAETWAAKFSWTARALAWQEHQEAEKRLVAKISDLGESAGWLDTVRKTSRSQAEEASEFRAVLSLPVKELVGRLVDNPELLKDFSLKELLGLVAKFAPAWAAVVKPERLALGLSTEFTESKIFGDVSVTQHDERAPEGMSVDDWQEFGRFMAMPPELRRAILDRAEGPEVQGAIEITARGSEKPAGFVAALVGEGEPRLLR